MSRGGTRERKTLGAGRGSTPFRVESIDDGAHRRRWALSFGKLQKFDQCRTREFVRSLETASDVNYCIKLETLFCSYEFMQLIKRNNVFEFRSILVICNFVMFYIKIRDNEMTGHSYNFISNDLCVYVCAPCNVEPFSIRSKRTKLRLAKYLLDMSFFNLRLLTPSSVKYSKNFEDNLTSETIRKPDDRRAPKTPEKIYSNIRTHR